MGKIVGSNVITGKVGRLRHYRMQGVKDIVVAELGGATKEQIKHHPAFVRTREVNAEWRGVTKMASEVKLTLGSWTRRVVNRYLIGQLNKTMVAILQKDKLAPLGSRSIYLSRWRDDLMNIDYYCYKPLREILRCRYSFEITPDRKSLTVHLYDLWPKEQIKAPNSATHFRLCLSLGVICDHLCTVLPGIYEPQYPSREMQMCRPEFESEWFPVDSGPMGDLTLSVALRDDLVLKEDMNVLPVFGMIFGQMATNVTELKRESGSLEFLGAV